MQDLTSPIFAPGVVPLGTDSKAFRCGRIRLETQCPRPNCVPGMTACICRLQDVPQGNDYRQSSRDVSRHKNRKQGPYHRAQDEEGT